MEEEEEEVLARGTGAGRLMHSHNELRPRLRGITSHVQGRGTMHRGTRAGL